MGFTNGYARTHCIPVEMYCHLLLGSLYEKKAFKRKGVQGRNDWGRQTGSLEGDFQHPVFSAVWFTPGHLLCAFMTVILHDPASCVCRVAAREKGNVCNILKRLILVPGCRLCWPKASLHNHIIDYWRPAEQKGAVRKQRWSPSSNFPLKQRLPWLQEWFSSPWCYHGVTWQKNSISGHGAGF